MRSIIWYSTKLKIKEALKYDLKLLGLIPNIILFGAALVLFYLNKQILAYNLCGNIFRTNWHGSLALPKLFMKLTLGEMIQDNKKVEDIVRRYITNLSIEPNKQKFFDNPSKMLVSMIIVVRPWTQEHNGILIIKYSYYYELDNSLKKLFHN